MSGEGDQRGWPDDPSIDLEPLTALVLHRTTDRWTFAIFGGGGVVDGWLEDVAITQSEDDAQKALERLIMSWTDREVRATWHAQRANWWAADAAFATPGHSGQRNDA